MGRPSTSPGVTPPNYLLGGVDEGWLHAPKAEAIESIAARQGRVRGDAAPRGHDQPGQFRMRLNGSGVRARCWRPDASLGWWWRRIQLIGRTR